MATTLLLDFELNYTLSYLGTPKVHDPFSMRETSDYRSPNSAVLLRKHCGKAPCLTKAREFVLQETALGADFENNTAGVVA